MRNELDRKRRRGDEEHGAVSAVPAESREKKRKRTGYEKRRSRRAKEAGPCYRVRRTGPGERGAGAERRDLVKRVPRRRRKTRSDRRRREEAVRGSRHRGEGAWTAKGRTWRGRRSGEERRARHEWRQRLPAERKEKTEVPRWAEATADTVARGEVAWRRGSVLREARGQRERGARKEEGLGAVRQRRQVSKRARGRKRQWARLLWRLQAKVGVEVEVEKKMGA